MTDNYRIAELERMLANMIQITTISTVDFAHKKIRVKLGPDESAELPWPADIGRNYVRWKPLRDGQQVVIACPDGDPAKAVIITQLYSDEMDSPSTDKNMDVIEFNNGARIEHNINNGIINLSGFSDVLVNGISVPFHTHNKVRAGTDNTGMPQK